MRFEPLVVSKESAESIFADNPYVFVIILINNSKIIDSNWSISGIRLLFMVMFVFIVSAIMSISVVVL